jgi:hypothetical protein
MECQTQSTLISKSMQWAVVVSMVMEAILTFAANHVGGRAKGLSKINLTTIKWFSGVVC